MLDNNHQYNNKLSASTDYHNQVFSKNVRETDSHLLPVDIAFLLDYQHKQQELSAVNKRAIENGVDAHLQLIYESKITRERYYRCLAEYLGVSYKSVKDIGKIEYFDEKGLIQSLRTKSKLFIRDSNNRLQLITSPDSMEINHIKQQLIKKKTLIKILLLQRQIL